MELTKKVEKELNALGLSPRLVGYWDLLTAIDIVARNKTTLTAIMSEIYAPTAAVRSVECGCVEASIRKAIRSIWKRGNRERLEQIMRHSLLEPPTTGEFLGAFVFHLEEIGAGYKRMSPR